MLEAVKRWLEPLPDKSLPALNIQRPLMSLLRTVRRLSLTPSCTRRRSCRPCACLQST